MRTTLSLNPSTHAAAWKARAFAALRADSSLSVAPSYDFEAFQKESKISESPVIGAFLCLFTLSFP